jgi:hypothetical protein
VGGISKTHVKVRDIIIRAENVSASSFLTTPGQDSCITVSYRGMSCKMQISSEVKFSRTTGERKNEH